MALPLAAAIGVAIFVIGRFIIQFGGRIAVRYVLPILRAALRLLKDQAIEIGQEALREAIDLVIDFITGSGGQLKDYIKEKSSLLPKQGSPNTNTCTAAPSLTGPSLPASCALPMPTRSRAAVKPKRPRPTRPRWNRPRPTSRNYGNWRPPSCLNCWT